MKRIVSLVLSISLLFTGIIPATAEATLPILYEYPPVSFVLFGQNSEEAFREWAASIIERYRNEYAVFQDDYSLQYGKMAKFAEYYELAMLKRDFLNTSMKDSVRDLYTGDGGAEVEMAVFLESLEEAIKLDANLKKQFDTYAETYGEKYAKLLRLDVATGSWSYSTQLAAEDQKALLNVEEAAANLLIDAIDLTVDIAQKSANFAGAASSENIIDKVIDVIIEAVTKGLESATQNIKENETKKINNEVKQSLAEDLANKMLEVNDLTIMYLQYAYETNFENNPASFLRRDELVSKFLGQVGKENSTELQKEVGIAAEENTASDVKNISEAFGLEVEKTLSDSVILGLALLNGTESGLNEFVKTLIKSVKDNELLDAVMTSIENLITTNITASFDAAEEAVKTNNLENGLEAGAISDMLIDSLKKKFNNDFFWGNLSTIISGVIDEYTNSNNPALQAAGALALSVMKEIDTIQQAAKGGKSVQETATEVVKNIGKHLSDYTKVKAKEFDKQYSAALSARDKAKETMENKAADADMMNKIYENSPNGDYEAWNDSLIANQESLKAQTAYEEANRSVETSKKNKGYAESVGFIAGVWGKMMDCSASLAELMESSANYANHEALVAFEIKTMKNAYEKSVEQERVIADRTRRTPEIDGMIYTINSSVLQVEQGALGTYTTEDYREVVKAAGLVHPEYIRNDHNVTSLNDIQVIVSKIKTQLKYDIVGQAAYVTLAAKKDMYAGSQFMQYVVENHVNSNGTLGLLDISENPDAYWEIAYADAYYNYMVEFENQINEGWREEWKNLL